MIAGGQTKARATFDDGHRLNACNLLSVVKTIREIDVTMIHLNTLHTSII